MSDEVPNREYHGDVIPEYLFPTKQSSTVVSPNELKEIRSALDKCDVEFFKNYFAEGGKPYISLWSGSFQNGMTGRRLTIAERESMRTRALKEHGKIMREVMPREVSIFISTSSYPILSILAPAIAHDEEKRNRYLAIIKLAQEHGMDINACSDVGHNILDIGVVNAISAPKMNSAESLCLLHKLGANLNMDDPDDLGKSFLDSLTYNIWGNLCKLVLKNDDDQAEIEIYKKLTDGGDPVIPKIKLETITKIETFRNMVHEQGASAADKWPEEVFLSRLSKIDLLLSNIAESQKTHKIMTLFMKGLGTISCPESWIEAIPQITQRANAILNLFIKHQLISLDTLREKDEAIRTLLGTMITRTPLPRNELTKFQAAFLGKLFCLPHFCDLNITNNNPETDTYSLHKSSNYYRLKDGGLTHVFPSKKAAELAQSKLERVRAQLREADPTQEYGFER